MISLLKGLWFWICIPCAIIVRLILTGDRDILAMNQPYDDFWFVQTAQNWIWGGGYSQMAFAQLQLYPVWLKAVSVVGIPARLAIDVVWLLASTYLGVAIGRICRSAWPGVLLFLFLSFHPFSIAFFDRALSEMLMAVLTAFVLAAFIEAWSLREAECSDGTRRMWAVVVASAAFALAFHIRKEGIVLLAPMALIVVISLFRRDNWWGPRMRWRAGFPLIVFPLAATLLLGFVLAGANYLRWGVFARYELAAPGYVRAINSLNAIDPGEQTPKYVTITAQTRAKAYAVSPTFAELKPFFEGPPGQSIAKATAAFTSGVTGEIANGWFYWALRDAAGIAGWHSSAVYAEQKYSQLADELQAAFAKGYLQRRPVLLSFVDPDWRKWLGDLPHAFVEENRLMVDLKKASFQLNLAEDARPDQFDTFVAIAGRRSPLPQTALAGWITVPEHSSIGLGTHDGTFVWQALNGPARPDVPGGLPFALVSKDGEIPTEVHVRHLDGRHGQRSLDDLKLGAVTGINGLPGANLGVDRMITAKRHFRANRLIPFFAQVWTNIGWLFLAASVGAMLFFRRGDRGNFDCVHVVMWLALIGIFARTGLLALLEASSWNALEQARYIFPALPFFAVVGALGTWVLGERLFSRIRGREG